MSTSRLLSKFFGAIIFLLGLALVCYILYSEIPWIIREYTWNNATGTITDIVGKDGSEWYDVTLHIEVEEKDGTIRNITKKYFRDTNDEGGTVDINIGTTKTVLYDPQNPNEVFFTSNILGVLITVAFGGVFILVGYLLISDTAGAKAQLKFAEWNRGFRLGFTAFLAVGVIMLIMAIFESPVFLFFAIPFTLLGGFGLYRFYSKEKLKTELPRTGQKIECTKIIVEQDSILSGYVVDTDERLSPYLIKCYATELSTNIPFVFESELIWFDPKPYLPDTIPVYVNPRDFTEYVMDISFLPKETRKISQRSFRIG
jgi:hypothetical protein